MLLARSPSIGENFGNTLVIAGRCHPYPAGRKQATTKAAEKLILGTEEFFSLRDSSRVSFFVKISMFFSSQRSYEPPGLARNQH